MAKTPTYKNDIGVPIIKIGTKSLKNTGRYLKMNLKKFLKILKSNFTDENICASSVRFISANIIFGGL